MSEFEKMIADLESMTLLKTGKKQPLTKDEKDRIKSKYADLIEQGKRSGTPEFENFTAEYCGVSIPAVSYTHLTLPTKRIV